MLASDLKLLKDDLILKAQANNEIKQNKKYFAE